MTVYSDPAMGLAEAVTFHEMEGSGNCWYHAMWCVKGQSSEPTCQGVNPRSPTGIVYKTPCLSFLICQMGIIAHTPLGLLRGTNQLILVAYSKCTTNVSCCDDIDDDGIPHHQVCGPETMNCCSILRMGRALQVRLTQRRGEQAVEGLPLPLCSCSHWLPCIADPLCSFQSKATPPTRA